MNTYLNSPTILDSILCTGYTSTTGTPSPSPIGVEGGGWWEPQSGGLIFCVKR